MTTQPYIKALPELLIEPVNSEYLEFTVLSTTDKTAVWAVRSKTRGDTLGYVKWFGRWRQYAFFPVSDTIWNEDCLNDIATFINRVRWARKP